MKLNKPQLCLDFFNKSFLTKQHNSSWYFQRNTMKQICNIISLNISNNAFIHKLSILCYERKKSLVIKNVGQTKINFGQQKTQHKF